MALSSSLMSLDERARTGSQGGQFVSLTPPTVLQPGTTPSGARVNRRSLRRHIRTQVRIRAVLYYATSFRSVVIKNISEGGAALECSTSLIQNDAITIKLISGRSIDARVRWWLGGICGVQFVEPLKPDDPLLSGSKTNLSSK